MSREMAKPYVDIEITIPSFYRKERTASGTLAWWEWTQRSWNIAPEHCNQVASLAVLNELASSMRVM